MANLFWKTPVGTKQLLSTPFKTEEEFEKTIFEASGILQDVFPIKRQVKGGGKSTIPDIIAIDQDENICVIEMKNVTVDPGIIPQVLQYAIWAETSPDSIKNLWLESKNKPEDLSPSWEKLSVRIIVVAPKILSSTLALTDKINYPIDLVEVTRWRDGDNELLLVDKLEREANPTRPKPVSGLEVYDASYFKLNFSENSAEAFLKLANEIEKLVQKHGWALELKFNKHYCAFKSGFFNAFGIKWISHKTFIIFFKLSETAAKQTGVKYTKYDQGWKEVNVAIDTAKPSIDGLLPLFQASYEKLAG